MEAFINITLAFAIVLIIVFTLGRIGDHTNIAQVGGIRTHYNEIFSFFYNLPNSQIKIETKSFVTFQIQDHRCSKSIRLNYSMDMLNITCKVTYYDDTPFENGKKFEWSVLHRGDSQTKVVEKIQETFSKLP
mgnify:CR=1 FL=1|jgi:hypothetical protein